jgi:phosphohistidine swiveling domain-containing protein
MRDPVTIDGTDDINRLLLSLHGASAGEVREGLARIVYYMRMTPLLSGTSTESVAGLEESMAGFMESYDGRDFEEIYTLIREIIRHIPRFNLFDIDITELRDIAHDFDAEYRDDPVFSSFASDIRRLVHQHLSDRVITKIDAFEEYLHSDKPSGLVDGSTIVGADREIKEDFLESEIFGRLKKLREKLQSAWIGSGSDFRQEYSGILPRIMRNLDLSICSHLESYEPFSHDFGDFLESLWNMDWPSMEMGYTRYLLKKLIEEISGDPMEGKGNLLLGLITMDVLLEQISFIHYSNIVNSDRGTVTRENYVDSLRIVYNLALCTRAVGHGTKHLGRFAFLMEELFSRIRERPDRVAHFPSILDAMTAELENNFFSLRDLYSRACRGTDDVASSVTRLLNNIIREKTTHLLGNMINNIRTFHEGEKREVFQKVLADLDYSENIPLSRLIFRFGTDDNEDNESKINPEFMGGKGLSQVRNSRIVIDNGLQEVHIPPGFGYSTLTWHALKGSGRMDEFRSSLKEIVRKMENRTGKRFGDPGNPLLLMARSGAMVSMPGILDTISHIGINEGIARQWSLGLDEPFRAFQACISFMLSYARSVLDLDPRAVIRKAGSDSYEKLYLQDLEGLTSIAERIKGVITEMDQGRGIPDDPFEQLFESTLAVFRSFEKEIVQLQVREMRIPEMFQTACLVQECLPIMTSRDCSGVYFTRNPVSGRIGNRYPEQIEFREGFFGDVIADGLVAPSSIEDFMEGYPEHYDSLSRFRYHDERVQRFPTDIEFALRRDRLYIVQSRTLKQSPIAVIANSYDFYREGIYSEFKLIKRTAFSLNRPVVVTYLDRKVAQEVPVIGRGKPVNGGAVRGCLVKDPIRIPDYEGPLIFVTESNVPPGVILKEKRFAGYISREGGITSHAALVAIGERKPCITDVHWQNGDGEDIHFDGMTLKQGDSVTMDANTGSIYLEEIPIITWGLVTEELDRIRSEIIDVIDNLISRDPYRKSPL